MRMQIFGGILIVLLASQVPLHAVTPVESVTLDGLTAEVSLGAGWTRSESTSQQVVFERTVDGRRATLSFSATPIELLPDNEAFFRFAEHRQEAVLSKLKMVGVHYNYNRVDDSGVPCLRYDGIFEDKAAHVSPFSSIIGWLCRHPASAEKMIQVELAQRSGTRAAANEVRVDLAEMAEQVFSAVQFTQPAR